MDTKKKVKRYFDGDDDQDKRKDVSSNSKKRISDDNSESKVDSGEIRGNNDIVEISTDLHAKIDYKKLNKLKFQNKKKSKYPGKPKIPKEKLEKYSKGDGLEGTGVKNKYVLEKLKRKERHIKFATEQAARTEVLLPEDVGYLEADEGETTTEFTQKQIAKSVDIAAASKHFELQLREFGPYKIRYTRNGRHLLLGGRMGHVAAFDWFTKKLHCEMSVMETVHEICWTHVETLYAVAQKDWVYMYDNKGIEIHCLKKLNKVLTMEFLPYHFLLATGSEFGYLSWLDISIGEIVRQFHTNLGKINIMKQNPYNGVLCIGQSKGVVDMWSPNTKTPLASILCHKAPLTSLTIDPKGLYMATSSIDKSVKIWDVRKLEGPMQTYMVRTPASQVEFSHKNMLAIGMGNVVEVYRDCCTRQAERPYLRHRMNAYVEQMRFCPYEDVLGVGTNQGFVSLIVPGSGEANYDALEANPYQSKSQRREAEVKALLEKIPADLISLDPSAICGVDVPTLKEKVEAHNKLTQLKPKKINYKARRKSKTTSTVKIARNKKIVQELENREFGKKIKDILPKAEKPKGPVKSYGVLDRFVDKRNR